MSRKTKENVPVAPAGAPIPPVRLNDRWLIIGICIFLAAITFAVFGQTLRYGFVNFDDNLYIYDNPIVQKGLTWEGFRWAFTYGGIGHWHPLTWLSHMLDCQLYGLHAGGHHLTNVLLHTASVILLFLILRQLTGFLWRSAFVAAVFAVHPLHVESVVWIAERKDVLSGLFFMLTLAAYVHYVRRPPSMRRYGLVVLCFALGLLAKDMLVTLPFVLLLLDYWPLERIPDFSLQALRPRVVEKIPLFVLTIVSCVITLLVPEKMAESNKLPLGLRLENAVVSYVIYLWQMICPTKLACLYPNPTHLLPIWQVIGALLFLLIISAGAFFLRRKYPWFIVGWLWYLGMMVPVIGFVQISVYAHADRYTYLPQIGLYCLLTWAVADWCAAWRYRRVLLGGCSAVILVALIVLARVQTAYWQDSELLWNHTLACTTDNYIAQYGLGEALIQKGKMDQAITPLQTAVQIKPDYEKARQNLGAVLLEKGEVAEAISNLQAAVKLSPHDLKAHNNLGLALLEKGEMNEAVVQLQIALQIKPNSAEAHYNLANAMLETGHMNEAITQFQAVLQVNPNFLGALNSLAMIFATCPEAALRNGNQAVVLAQRANQIARGENPTVLSILAAAYAEAGRFPDAVAVAQHALELAETQSKTELADTIRSQLQLYQAGKPFHYSE